MRTKPILFPFYLNLSGIIFILSFFLTFPQKSFSKVEPANFSFSLDQFNSFFPGNSLASLQEKVGKGVLFSRDKDLEIYRFFFLHNNYKFPIYVQFNQNIIVDFYATLPSFFLHDPFHQSLIALLGKQDKYFKKEKTAIFIWEREKHKNIYSATCTNTCFPLFYSVIDKEYKKKNPKYLSLLEKFNKAQ